jgi:NADH-quinone oxidoreductase subunit C
MTSPEATLERIQTALAGLEFEVLAPRDGTPQICVEADALHAVLERLRDEAGFRMVTFVTAVDRLGEQALEPRFEVYHQLLSVAHADRVRVRTRVPSDAAAVPTCTDLWPGASFMERECWDLLGIEFEGHPDLRRLLMPDGYGHHPLRKDFPHQGIEPDRLYREWDAERRKSWTSGEEARPR